MSDFFWKHGNEMKAAMYGVFLFLNINVDIVHILIWLMFIDTGFGVVKAWALGGKFTFPKLFWGLISKLVVLLVPMIIALVGKALSQDYDFRMVLDGVLRVLVLSEGLSIFSNMIAIKTKKNVESIDVMTMLLSSIRKWMLMMIKRTLGTIDTAGDKETEV